MKQFRTIGLGLLAATMLSGAAAAQSDEGLKVGLIFTLSGPPAVLGEQARDGFLLAVEEMGGKLGGMETEIIVVDDELKPDVAVNKARELVERDGADFVVGPIFSNILQAIMRPVTDGGAFLISPNAGTSNFAGAECHENFFVTSYQNDQNHEVLGKYAEDQGYERAFLLAPNYQAGKDSLAGFKRFYKGNVAAEVYTKLGQLDYSAELAQVRAARPDALYIFLPGGMGINFIKQFVAAGLSKDVPLIVPGFGSDQDIIRPVGEPMLGLFDTAHWALDLDNAANKKFVAAFEKEFKRLPSVFAAQGYDTALLIDAAVRDTKGKVEDVEAVRRALRAAKFESVRGAFKFNRNQYPIQNYYLRVVAKDNQGRIVNKTIGTVFKDHGDAYVQDCRMK